MEESKDGKEEGEDRTEEWISVGEGKGWQKGRTERDTNVGKEKTRRKKKDGRKERRNEWRKIWMNGRSAERYNERDMDGRRKRMRENRECKNVRKKDNKKGTEGGK